MQAELNRRQGDGEQGGSITTEAPASRSQRPAFAYLALGLGLMAAFFLLPPSWQNQTFDVIGLSAVAAIVIGTVRNQPTDKLAWYLMAAGQFLFVTGDMVWTYYEVVLHQDGPFPSVADVAYLAGYVPLAIGLLRIVRHRRPGRDMLSLVDAAVVTVAAAVGSWIFLMAPQVTGSDVAGTVVSLAYPMADVLLIAVAASLVFAADTRAFSYRLIGASLIALIVADAAYIPATLNETYHTGHILDVGWVLSYVLWGTAALHPSMRKLTEPVRSQERHSYTRRRLVTEGIAIFAIPFMWSIQTIRDAPRHSVVVVAGSTIASLLVILRMGGLLETLEQAALRDPLTGLPNRRLLLDRLTQAFRRSERSGVPIAVLFLDLGGFKRVNDRFGHEAGDEALVAVGQRIEAVVRRTDTVARLGGDEFVIVCEGLDRIQAEMLAHRVRAGVSKPLEIKNELVEITVDLGDRGRTRAGDK